MTAPSLTPRNRDQLRAAMYETGYDTVLLGRAAGVTKQHIRAILTGRSGCSEKVAAAIAQALNTPKHALFRPTLSGETNNMMENDNMPPTLTLTTTDDRWLYFEDVAKLVELPPATLRYWRHLGKGPDFQKFGRRLRIRKSVAEAWIKSLENAQ